MQFIMQRCLSLCLLLVPLVRSAALLEYGAPPPADAINQYHFQDDYGQYAYGYTTPLYAKHETRSSAGVVQGAFSYIDANGQLQRVTYNADAGGFHVQSNSHQPNRETPEVAALRARHLAAHEEIKQRLAGGLPAVAVVQDTPEVAAAKVAFFKRFEAEKLRNERARNAIRSIFW